jgi:hypothetical protein
MYSSLKLKIKILFLVLLTTTAQAQTGKYSYTEISQVVLETETKLLNPNLGLKQKIDLIAEQGNQAQLALDEAIDDKSIPYEQLVPALRGVDQLNVLVMLEIDASGRMKSESCGRARSNAYIGESKGTLSEQPDDQKPRTNHLLKVINFLCQ